MATDLIEYATQVSDDDQPSILVLGCGHSPTMETLIEHGVDAYGVDEDTNALNQIDIDRNRLLPADITDEEIIGDIKARFDIEHVDVCYGEKVLSPLHPDKARDVLTRFHESDLAAAYLYRFAPFPPVDDSTTVGTFVRTVDDWNEFAADGHGVFVPAADPITEHV